MKKILLTATAAATILATYFLLTKRYANPGKNLPSGNHLHPGNQHHLTQAFAKAKKHAVG